MLVFDLYFLDCIVLFSIRCGHCSARVQSTFDFRSLFLLVSLFHPLYKINGNYSERCYSYIANVIVCIAYFIPLDFDLLEMFAIDVCAFSLMVAIIRIHNVD